MFQMQDPRYEFICKVTLGIIFNEIVFILTTVFHRGMKRMKIVHFIQPLLAYRQRKIFSLFASNGTDLFFINYVDIFVVIEKLTLESKDSVLAMLAFEVLGSLTWLWVSVLAATGNTLCIAICCSQFACFYQNITMWKAVLSNGQLLENNYSKKHLSSSWLLLGGVRRLKERCCYPSSFLITKKRSWTEIGIGEVYCTL